MAKKREKLGIGGCKYSFSCPVTMTERDPHYITFLHSQKCGPLASPTCKRTYRYPLQATEKNFEGELVAVRDEVPTFASDNIMVIARSDLDLLQAPELFDINIAVEPQHFAAPVLEESNTDIVGSLLITGRST